MFAVEIRPSLRILQQVATIERFCGGWERVVAQAYFSDSGHAERKLLEGVIAAAELDQSTPPAVLMQLRELREQQAVESVPHPVYGNRAYGNGAYGNAASKQPLTRIQTPLSAELRALFSCHRAELEFGPAIVELCHRALCGEAVELTGLFSDRSVALDSGELDTTRFRRQAMRFAGPGNEVLFQTVPAFLIEQRLTDLLEWTQTELDVGRYHPLLVAGLFFLLFLQISPYDRANHRLALVLLWHFLEQSGYTFIRHSHFAVQFHRNSAQYFSALRQAEKSAYGNWSTLNVWLEFFLQTLCVGCEEISNATERSTRQSRLSSVQRDILEVIRTCGSATRERIVKDTGINLSTVKYNLTVLSARGHLKREGGGRSTSYTLS